MLFFVISTLFIPINAAIYIILLLILRNRNNNLTSRSNILILLLFDSTIWCELLTLSIPLTISDCDIFWRIIVVFIWIWFPCWKQPIRALRYWIKMCRYSCFFCKLIKIKIVKVLALKRETLSFLLILIYFLIPFQEIPLSVHRFILFFILLLGSFFLLC